MRGLLSLIVFLILKLSLVAEDKVLVCLHGFMRSYSNMSLFSYQFKKEGWEVYVYDYPSKKRTIEEHSLDFIEYLEELQEKHPDATFYYATHSMGALILRAALSSEECPKQVKQGKAVLVAPPNRGSAYGRFLSKFKKVQKLAGPNAGRQLLFTKKDGFDYLGSFPESLRVMVIAGTCGCNPTIEGLNDGKVGIEETRLKTPHLYKEVFAGHSWICHTPKTVELALDFFLDERL